MPMNPDSIYVGAREVTREEYQQMGREERLVLWESLCEGLARAQATRVELLRAIREGVDEQFAPLLAAVPIRLPAVWPRLKGDPNPDWWRLREEREETCRRIVSTIPPVRSSHEWPSSLQAAFLSWEQALETPEEELARLLEEHDWHYAMSDDFSVWSRGYAASRRLLALVAQLGPEARVAYDRACPWKGEEPIPLPWP